MEERDQILIERYLAGELTETERHDVERRREEDPLFRQELIAYQTAIEALRQKQREELRQRFVKRDEILDQKKPGPTSQDKNRFNWMWLVVALVVALVIWRFFFSSHQEAMPVQIDASDTTKIEQTPTVRIDTISPPGEKEKNEDKRSKEVNPPMAGKDTGGGELFAEYYEPYKDAMMDPTTRGDEELSPVQKYQKAYWDGEYQKSVELFSQIPNESRENDNVRFSYANALLETGKTDQAITILDSIIKNNRSRYVAEAYFGLGMGHLRKGNMAQARDWLVKYVNLDKAKQKEVANKIILRLNE